MIYSHIDETEIVQFKDIKGKVIQVIGDDTLYEIIEDSYCGDYNYFTVINNRGYKFSFSKNNLEHLLKNDDRDDNIITREYIRQNLDSFYLDRF